MPSLSIACHISRGLHQAIAIETISVANMDVMHGTGLQYYKKRDDLGNFIVGQADYET
jgi:hypothetical protein